MRCLLSLACAALAALSPAQLTVTSIAPARNATAAPTATPITMTFDAPLDPASVTGRSFQVFGKWSGVGRGVVSVENGGRTIRFEPNRAFFPGEAVTVAASSAIRAMSGATLSNGYAFQFWVKPARGSGVFALARTINVRRTGEGRVQSYGAYAGDLDGDGSPELSIPNEISSDVRVFKNDGCGGFSAPVVHQLPSASTPSPNEGSDFNGDGVTDLAVANLGGASVSILIGDGAGGFRPHVTYPVGSQPRGIAVLDVDVDGDADVATSNYGANNIAILRNRGDGTFMPAVTFDTGASGERSLGAADMNGDGIMDLVVGHYNSETFAVLRGDARGGFTVAGSASSSGKPWMLVLGDLNGDGHVDVASSNFTNQALAVSFGNGAGGLGTASTYAAGSQPLAVDVGDFEGDGDLDLSVSNFGGSSWMTWRNDGLGNFGQRQTFPAPAAGSCMIVVDFDRDGDADLIGIDEIADQLLVFAQQGPSPSGVQPPGCAAALRVANSAERAGYGAAAPHLVDSGGRLLLGVSGAPLATFALFASNALEPGLATAFGLLNLDLGALVPLPGGTLDPAGELYSVLLLPAAASGATIALQALVLDLAIPAAVLTNPERIAVR
jgi:hypothetical protein